MELNTTQQRAIALAPKFTAAFSIPCSIFLIYEVVCDYQKGKVTPIKRILVGMSVIDVLSSSGWFLSTWAVPKGSFAFSAGNRATCSYQGFLLQLAVGAPLYNSSLALFYLLIIKFRWTDERLRKVEYWVHGFILLFAIGTSILLLPLKQYNHIGAVCWVIGDPKECKTSSFQDSDILCERGKHAWLYGIFLFYLPLWVCVIACCFSMGYIYMETRRTIGRMHRYSVSGRDCHSLSRSDKDSGRVAIQALLYSLTFVITWMPSTLWSVAHWFNWSSFWLDLISGFCEPLQGFWNLCIFARYRLETQAKIWKFLSRIFPCVVFNDEDFKTSHIVRSSTGGKNHTSAPDLEQQGFHTSDDLWPRDQSSDAGISTKLRGSDCSPDEGRGTSLIDVSRCLVVRISESEFYDANNSSISEEEVSTDSMVHELRSLDAPAARMPKDAHVDEKSFLPSFVAEGTNHVLSPVGREGVQYSFALT